MRLFQEIKSQKTCVAVVGLGYVGLPLAVEFGRRVTTVGFDVNQRRIADLKKFYDSNHETSSQDIRTAKKLRFTSNPAELKNSKFIIIAVPTPVTKNKIPDLSFVQKAAKTAGKNLQKGSIVVFEPTVYPGVTEEVCVPILEKESGLKYLKDFKVGYSPERINPGDKKHGVADIVKVVSGCDKESLDIIAKVYALVVKKGVFRAASIKTAEAAKVIENTQRDLNIALMNELALIFHKMGVDTRSVIDAAATKWNFIKFYPGLVGGHCIGVDPYYLTYKAKKLGHHPQVILSGRKINDRMGRYVAEQTVRYLKLGGKKVKGAKIMVMGITFKENVSDIRNSRVIELITALKKYGIDVRVCDPLADPKEVKREYGLKLHPYEKSRKLDGVIVAVRHSVFAKILTIGSLVKHLKGGSGHGVVVDVKGMFRPEDFKSTGLLYWRL